ncbi:MAG TPA: hypothetical protein VMB49_11910 [Acidobacteriaceae bacterium]|nr:hypothetical protein [Acidobacteriaceae bacterium]
MIDSTFPHNWNAEILASRPLILPARQFVYPAQVDEVERGALEVMVRPSDGSRFLATCALGFADPVVPTGVWSCPDPAWICAVAGGYAYLIDSRDPARWEQVEYRPVTAVSPVPDHDLLVFAGFHSLLAWGPQGKAWQTGRLSWDGVSITGLRAQTLLGLGWDMATDRELEFEVDLKTGRHSGGGYLV